jgi:hypothetical protein
VIRFVVVDDHPAIAAAIGAAIEDRADSARRDGVRRRRGHPPGRGDVARRRRLRPWLAGSPRGWTSWRPDGRGPGTRAPRCWCQRLRPAELPPGRIRGGAAGYLSKASPVEAIVEAIVAVAAGEQVPDVTLRALRDAPRRPSSRELDAIRLLARGASNDEIAVGLGISVKTVESHLGGCSDGTGC